MLSDIESVRLNLADAGCDEELIDSFVSAYTGGRIKDALAMLARHRNSLLDGVHDGERKIYRLDYLLNKLDRKET